MCRRPCDPLHRHHKGADALATAGLKMQAPGEAQLNKMHGEEDYNLTVAGILCQGNIHDALKEAARQQRLEIMAKPETGKKANDWAQLQKLRHEGNWKA